MYNKEVRAQIKIGGFRNFEVAAQMGMNECSFSRKLNRSELPTEEKQRIFDAIKTLYQIRSQALMENPIGKGSE